MTSDDETKNEKEYGAIKIYVGHWKIEDVQKSIQNLKRVLWNKEILNNLLSHMHKDYPGFVVGLRPHAADATMLKASFLEQMSAAIITVRDFKLSESLSLDRGTQIRESKEYLYDCFHKMNPDLQSVLQKKSSGENQSKLVEMLRDTVEKMKIRMDFKGFMINKILDHLNGPRNLFGPEIVLDIEAYLAQSNIPEKYKEYFRNNVIKWRRHITNVARDEMETFALKP